jgi:hypothetical protein
LLRGVTPCRIDIAHAQHTHITAGQAISQQSVALLAKANKTQRDLFAGRAVLPPQTGAQNQRRGSGQGGGLQKTAAGEGTG